MNQERLAILNMLAEGKINAEEAEMLLRALDEAAAPDEQTDAEDEKPKEGKELLQNMTEIFQEVGREIEVEVGRAVESVQRSGVQKIVSEVVDQVKSSVSEVVDSVSDIADITDEDDKKQRVKQQLNVFEGTGITKIDAQTANGRIALEGSDRDGVTVRAWKEVRGRRNVAAEFAEKVEIYAEQIGDELRVFTEHPPPPRGVNLAVRYAIETPREVDANLRTVNGKIEISGISGSIDATTVNDVIKLEGDTGPIRARTTNGKIEISGISGSIDATTVNDVIKLEGDTGPIRARTTNGSVRAEIGSLTEDAEFSTTNGSIGVEVHRGVGSVAALTTNGSIDLTLPADFAGQLDAEARRGRVHSDFPIPVVGKIRNKLKGEIGEGGEAVVKLRSTNGSIRLKRQDAPQS